VSVSGAERQRDADLGIDVDDDGALIRVALSGELDLISVDRLRDCLGDLVTQGHRLVEVDMRRLAWCDSLGLAALLGAAEICREVGGRLTVTGATGPVARVMMVTGVDEILRSGSGGAGEGEAVAGQKLL
jgi:anti-anti-sigma factor